MFKKALLLALVLSASPALAQNPTCPTRPAGDSTNACASTAFVRGAIPLGAITGLTGDAVATGPGVVPIVFATVNANVGSFGSSTQCVALTVNAKGLVTGASATTCTPAFSSITGTTNVVTNAILAQMPAATVKCNPTASTANAQDCPGAATGFAEMRPFPSQASGGTNPWNVIDPFGNSMAASCSGTTTQCLNEFVAAAKAAGWSWRIVGNGTISITSAGALPTCSAKTEYIDVGVTIQPSTTLGSAPTVTIDSHENCYSKFLGQIVQNASDTGPSLSLKPTNTDTFGNITYAANYMELPTSITPAAGGSGIQLDPTAGGFNGNTFFINDVNGGTTGFKILNPGTAFIAVEQNKFKVGYIHGQTVRTGQILTSGTNQGNVRYNTWEFGRIDPGTGATAGWDTWEVNGTYINLAIDNETANATTGLVVESGANNNNFFGGVVQATTAVSDSGTGTIFCGMKGATNNCIRSNVPLSNGTVALAQNTTAFQVTVNGTTEANVQVLCPYTGTFRNLFVKSTAPAAAQTLISTLRVNGSDTSLTCTVTGAGTSCSDTTHTAACTAGQAYSLKTVTSATTGSLASIAAGVEYDYP